jgi:hypothetical protein
LYPDRLKIRPPKDLGNLFVKYLFKVVEVFVHPMLENIENSELNRLLVLFPEPFHVLSDLDLRFFVENLRIGGRFNRKFRIGNLETLKDKTILLEHEISKSQVTLKC